MTLETGTLINQRYRVTEILGQGGMGSVYRAMDENIGVEVALKENLFMSDEYARQFHREAVILASLRHPNLPRVTDHFVIPGQGQYLVMDFIEGEDLRQRMDRERTISEEEVVIIGAAICDALNYLENRTQPIIHRDIKPGNVKITPTGLIYLVDFGLAKMIQGSEATTTGARAMTPGYSPPEQYGTGRTDHRSDLFSLGATLYAALTGYIPEDALSRAVDQIPLTPIRQYNPSVSQKLSDVIEKALAVRPDERYQSALQFKDALLASKTGLVLEDGNYWVEPPPEEVEKNHARWAELLDQAFDQSNKLGQAQIKNGIAQPVKQTTGRRFNFIWFSLFSFFILLLFAIILIRVFDPDLFSQGVEMVFSSAYTSTPFTGTMSTPIASTSFPSEILFTPTIQNPMGVYPTITAIEPVLTAVPSHTFTPQPTMVGGGTGEIAFVSDRSGIFQIWVMDSQGGNLRQITNLPEGACQPDWSPDGKQLVFISPCESNKESYPGSGLFIVSEDGSGLSPLSTVPGGDYDPDWSPDGDYIVFTSLRVTGRPRIYLMNLVDKTEILLSDPYSRDSEPAWSPDGAQIAYVTRNDGPSDIWVMSGSGENKREYSLSGGKINSHPVWSMDGEVILFIQKDSLEAIPRMVAASYVEGDYSEYIFDLGPIPVREANYSPDGLWLVFESWPDGRNHDIYILTVSGAIRTRLTDYDRVDFDPVWRPALSR